MKTSADSIVSLATSTLICVIVLMALSTLPEPEVPDRKFQYWWWYHKWLIAVAFLLMVFGVVQTSMAMNYVYELKMPDNARLQLCEEAGWLELNPLTQGGAGDGGQQSVYGFAGVDPESLPLSPERYPVPEPFCSAGVWSYVECSNNMMLLLGTAFAVIVSGYGSLAYELESLPCSIKLAAGSDFNPHASDTDTEKLSRLFQQAADAGIDPASMVRIQNDVLLDSMLKDAGIEVPGDRLKLILHIKTDPRLDKYRTTSGTEYRAQYHTGATTVAETSA